MWEEYLRNFDPIFHVLMVLFFITLNIFAYKDATSKKDSNSGAYFTIMLSSMCLTYIYVVIKSLM